MDQERLGECLAVFGAKRGVLIAGSVFAVLNACLGAFIMAGAFIVPVNPRANPLVHQGLFIGVGAVMLLGSAYLLFLVRRNSDVQVSLHLHGLTIQRGDRTSVLAWDEIDVVWHMQAANLRFQDHLASMIDGSQSVYTLSGPGGERVVLNSTLQHHETLGAAIKLETTSRLLPEAIRTYRVEGRVEFGRLAVDREGLSKGSRLLPWTDVGSVAVQNGFVHMRRRNRRVAWFGVRMGKVPNLYVFLALVRMILASQPLSK
jgi:hypothetical protein